MKIKAAIFDVDGTLVPHGAYGPGERNIEALRALQAKGIAVIIASGRARYTAQSVLTDAVRPDYFAAANGCDVTDAAGRTIWRIHLTKEEMDALVSFCGKNAVPLEFLFCDAYYAYVDYPAFVRKYESSDAPTKGIAQFLRNGEDRTRHLRDMPFAACTTMERPFVEEFARRFGALGLRFVSFEPDKYDILRAGASKAAGVEQLLRRLDIPWEEVAMFGDGDNDREIFARAGFRVAMGDGAPELCAMASAVAPAAAESGVARAIEKYLL